MSQLRLSLIFFAAVVGSGIWFSVATSADSVTTWNFDHTIDVKHWHTLHVIARGCRIQVLYDEQPVFDLCDRTFPSGLVGLWTKSDAVTYFDDLRLQLLR